MLKKVWSFIIGKPRQTNCTGRNQNLHMTLRLAQELSYKRGVRSVPRSSYQTPSKMLQTHPRVEPVVKLHGLYRRKSSLWSPWLADFAKSRALHALTALGCCAMSLASIPSCNQQERRCKMIRASDRVSWQTFVMILVWSFGHVHSFIYMFFFVPFASFCPLFVHKAMSSPGFRIVSRGGSGTAQHHCCAC